jgi:isoleucyl-tRNA synthetase
LGHAIRKKAKIKARQPLAKALVPVLNDQQRQHIAAVAEMVQAELNIKALEVIDASSGQITRKVKPDFKRLGPRLGPQMKLLAPAVAQLSQADILALEATGSVTLMLEGTPFVLQRDEVEILSEDVPGWSVASENGVTVALDITLTEALKQEGIARDLINRIQNLRKSRGLEVTDRIRIALHAQAEWQAAAEAYKSYICAETLADAISYELADDAVEIEIDGTTGSLNIVLS